MGVAAYFMSSQKKADMLVEAARYENVALVKYITGLKNVPTNHPQTRTGYLALVEAAKSGNMDVAKALLIHGANINAVDKSGTSPVMAALTKNRRGLMEMCLMLGADLTLKDDQSRTALSLAVQANRYALVKRLLEKFHEFRTTINEPDVLGRTPIIHAAMKGNLELAGLLVDYDANTAHTDVYGKDAADYAAAAGFIDLARMLSMGKQGLMIIRTDYFINAVGEGNMPKVEEFLTKDIEINRLHSLEGAGAMHRAAETNNVAMLDRLLAANCNIEVKNKFGETPVVVAALHECTEAVLFLMNKKANMRATSFDGLTPFQIAGKYGFPEIMKALFVEGGVQSMPAEEMVAVEKSIHKRTQKMFKDVKEKVVRKRGDDLVNAAAKGQLSRVDRLINVFGADVNHALSTHPPPPVGKLPTYHGRTPLIAAAEYGHAEVCAKLVQLGAEITLVDMFGENALMKASHRGHPDVITTLIMDNADIKYENEFNGKTALHYAAEGNQPAAVKRLLELGANPNCVTHGSLMTPIITACILGSTESTMALIESGADINAFDSTRSNALMHAGANGNDECVRALLEAGADITPENYFGRTALQTAMHKGRIGAIRLLLTATNRRRDKMGDDMIDAIRRQDRHTVRDALHFGVYFDHKHTVTGEEALNVAYSTGNTVIIELLRGAKIAQQDRTLAVSLADACKRGAVGQIQRLIDLNHVSPDATIPSNGYPAICTAADNGQLEAVRALVEAGAQIEAHSIYDGRTPLICAAVQNHLHVVQYLISMGARPLNIDMAGLTAMDYAEMNNRPDVLLILRLTIKARLLASKVRKNLQLRKFKSARRASLDKKMGRKGVKLTDADADALLKPVLEDGERKIEAETVPIGIPKGKHTGSTSFAQALGAFRKAGDQRSMLAALLHSVPLAVAAPVPALAAGKAANASSSSKASTTVKTTSVAQPQGSGATGARGGAFSKGVEGPVVAYESGEDDDADLVEHIDLDFSVRSPWVTEALKPDWRVKPK